MDIYNADVRNIANAGANGQFLVPTSVGGDGPIVRGLLEVKNVTPQRRIIRPPRPLLDTFSPFITNVFSYKGPTLQLVKEEGRVVGVQRLSLPRGGSKQRRQFLDVTADRGCSRATLGVKGHFYLFAVQGADDEGDFIGLTENLVYLILQRMVI